MVPARCGKEKSSWKSSRHSPVRRPGHLGCRGGVVRGQQRRPAALRPSVAGGLPLIGGGDQWFNCGGKQEYDNCERYGKVGNCGQVMVPVCRESAPPRKRTAENGDEPRTNGIGNRRGGSGSRGRWRWAALGGAEKVNRPVRRLSISRLSALGGGQLAEFSVRLLPVHLRVCGGNQRGTVLSVLKKAPVTDADA